MSNELVLRDHGALQYAVLRTTFVGAAAGLVEFYHHAPLVDAAVLFGLGCAVVVPKSLRSASVAAALACAAAGAWFVSTPLTVLGWTAGGAAAALTGMLFAREAKGGARRLLSTVAGALAFCGGLFVFSRSGVELAETLPWALPYLAAGAAGGFVAGFGALGREVTLQAALPAGDAALQRNALPPPAPASTETGELGELLVRARSASDDVERALGRDVPGAVAASQDLLKKVSAFAWRWRDIERQLARTDRAELIARMDRVGERSRAAADDVVRAEYQRAERALKQQLDDLDSIRGCQDRALARLHHHVAVLERLRLAALHRHSAESGKSAEALLPLVEELSAASLDLDGAAEVLAELSA